MSGAALAFVAALGAGCAAPAPEYVYVMPEEVPAPERSARPTEARVEASAGARTEPRGLDQSTPTKSLRSFVNAVRARRWDLVMQFIPEGEIGEGPGRLTPEKLERAWGGEMLEQIDASVAAIEAALDAGTEMEVVENRATLVYGAGKRVSLLREAGGWVVHDME